MSKFKLSKYSDAQLATLDNAGAKGAGAAKEIRGLKTQSENWDEDFYEVFADLDNDLAAIADEVLAATSKPKKAVEDIAKKVRERAKSKARISTSSETVKLYHKEDHAIPEHVRVYKDGLDYLVQCFNESKNDYETIQTHSTEAAALAGAIKYVSDHKKSQTKHSKPAPKKKNQGPLRGAARIKSETKAKRLALVESTLQRQDLQTLSEKEVLEVARQFNDLRTNVKRDEGTASKHRLSATPENLVRWMRDPGAFDLIGIDSARATTPTSDLKIKQKEWWARFGFK